MKKLVFILSHLLFWGWNLLWLALVYIWILPAIGIDLLTGTFEGVIPINFAITLLLLFAVPTICTVFGFRKHFRSSAYNLIGLLYGVEAPLFILLLLWLFLIRERTLSNSFMLATLLAVIATFGVELAYGYAQRRKALAIAQLVGHTLMVFVAVYLATLLMFYVAPLAFMLIREFFRFEWIEGVFNFLIHLLNPFVLIWGAFFLFSLTLFIGFPAALVSLYSYSGARLWQRFARQFGSLPAAIGASAVIIAYLFGFTMINQQPQHKAFFLLEQIAQKNSARQALLAESSTIRKGLLNAYLQSYRYLSPKPDATNIREWYTSKDALHFSVPVAQWFQNMHNLLLSPFLYDGEADDAEKAAKLYAEFFDTPIQRGETNAIKRALSSTYNRDEVKAGLMNINEEKVWLAQQQITVEPHGDWANVELYEVYENQTAEEQEVFYSFSLPESAVMTGLWLGDSANRDTRFAFQISPRGAAQQVYNEQVRVRRDPALLEQVGPRHYRLRAFPVPARESAIWRNRGRGRQRETRNAAVTPPKTLHLWLTYKVMRRDDQWPLPDLGEKRNIYWTKKTTCNYNGYETKHSGDDWLPPFLKANQPGQPALHELEVTSGYRVTITPLKSEDYAMPQGKRFALLIDTSYSMNRQADRLKQTLRWLKSDVLTANAVDLYLIDAQPELSRRVEYLGNAAFDLDELTFYGTVQFQEMISRFMTLRGDTAYDAILLITDEGSYELAQDKTTLPTLPAPLWMVHLGGMPKAYDDATLQAIEISGGGVASDALEVLQRLATTAKFGAGVNIVDGYKWQVEQTADTVAFVQQGDLQAAFDPLAARQLLRAIGKQRDMTTLASLDLAHGIATQFQIVSPYSSMIVLVNDEQRKALREAENKEDRFEREVETGHEALQKPFNPLHVPAVGANAPGSVPEPGTIGLFGLGVALLARQVIRRKRRAIL